MRVSDYFAPQIALHFHSYLHLHFPNKLTLTDTQKAYIYIQWAQRVCRIYALFVYYVQPSLPQALRSDGTKFTLLGNK